MGAVNPERRTKPEPCKECGEPLWEAYEYLCDACHAIGYLQFRYAIGWPMTDQDMTRLGLK